MEKAGTGRTVNVVARRARIMSDADWETFLQPFRHVRDGQLRRKLEELAELLPGPSATTAEEFADENSDDWEDAY